MAIPAQPTEYDLLATLPSGVRRVQVKSTTSRDEHGSWRAGISHRHYAADKSGRVPYDPDSLDYFFIISGDGDMYCIPSQVLAGKTSISVGAYKEYRVGDASSLFTVAT